MAIEYVSVTPGTGKNIAVDTISAIEFQVVKLALGADGANDGLVDSGQQASAASVPVVLSTTQSDPDSGAVLTVDFAHHEVHEGDAFTASFTVDLANGATADLLIVTPDTAKYAHMTWSVEMELESHISLWESVTATAAANPIVAYNRNRNSATASGLVITHTPTGITTGSTLIRESHGGTGKSLGGSRADNAEFVLKRNVKYLFRVLNSTTSTNYIAIRLDWYEHTDL